MFRSRMACQYQPGGRDGTGDPKEARNSRPDQFHPDLAVEVGRLVRLTVHPNGMVHRRKHAYRGGRAYH